MAVNELLCYDVAYFKKNKEYYQFVMEKEKHIRAIDGLMYLYNPFYSSLKVMNIRLIN